MKGAATDHAAAERPPRKAVDRDRAFRCWPRSARDPASVALHSGEAMGVGREPRRRTLHLTNAEQIEARGAASADALDALGSQLLVPVVSDVGVGAQLVETHLVGAEPARVPAE